MQNKSYSYFHDIFYSFLRERYGDNIISCQMYELRVVLDMAGIQDLRCERTLQVPAGITFHRLHKIIQTAFAWKIIISMTSFWKQTSQVDRAYL